MTITSSNNRTIITNKPSFLVNPEDKSIRKGKTVVCLDTGAIFKSAKEASIHYEINYGNMIANLLGKSKTTRGMKFMYVADMAFRVNDITSLIVELKANATTMADRATKAEAETKRVKAIWKEFTDKIKEDAEAAITA